MFTQFFSGVRVAHQDYCHHSESIIVFIFDATFLHRGEKEYG
jgi:hypothetical protein